MATQGTRAAEPIAAAARTTRYVQWLGHTYKPLIRTVKRGTSPRRTPSFVKSPPGKQSGLPIDRRKFHVHRNPP